MSNRMNWSQNYHQRCITRTVKRLHLLIAAEESHNQYTIKGLDAWSSGTPLWRSMYLMLDAGLYATTVVRGDKCVLYWKQAAFTNPQVDHELTSNNVIFSPLMSPPFLLLRWPISPGCVLSFSPPPSSPVRRRSPATSTAWRSSKAAHSSCPTMMTWSMGAAPASSAQVRSTPLVWCHFLLATAAAGSCYPSLHNVDVLFGFQGRQKPLKLIILVRIWCINSWTVSP